MHNLSFSSEKRGFVITATGLESELDRESTVAILSAGLCVLTCLLCVLLD